MKSCWKRRGQALAALLCSLALIGSIFPAYAEDIASLENKTSELQNQLDGINEELLAISDEISSTKMQIEISNGEIQRTKDSLAIAEANEQKQYEDMKTRIRYMYESGNASLLEMLFSADNMTDFLNKADFIQNISDYDREMLDELRKTQQEIETQKNTLETQQKSLVDLQKDLETRQQELNKKAAETQTDLAAYTAQLEQRRQEEAQRLASSMQTGNIVTDTTVSTTNPVSVSDSDLEVFAAILDCEAMHDYTSMLAVATVIMNRVNDSRFPDTVSGVVYASGQFEPVWTGRLDAVLSNGASELAYTVAKDALNGARLSAVSDCYYFLYAGATSRPGLNVGNNLFFQIW